MSELENMSVNTDISSKLTTDERYIFGVLREVAEKYYPNSYPRVCGGWVRDKIMGQQSSDIDVMLVGVSGEDFAKRVTKYIGVKNPHVVRANPEASKHLETAGASIPVPSGAKADVDFAMARTEVYHDMSRIPEIKPATAKEDAYRRDLTINSMFYNIITGQVEDFTGNGIHDLITKTIRTPEEPYKTFKDDPLRILRTIRFATKIDGKINPETYEAMKDPSLKKELINKVSKERIKDELSKIIKSKGAAAGINILKDIGLFDYIMEGALKGSEFDGKMSPLDMNQNNPNHELTVWDHSMEVLKHTLEQYAESDEEIKLIMSISALMHDFGKLYSGIQQQKTDRTTYKGHDDASAKIAKLILEFLKFENRITNNVVAYIGRHMYVHPLLPHEKEVKDKTLRRFVRKMGEESLSWIDLINLAIADAKARNKLPDTNIDEYNALRDRISALIEQGSYTEKQGVQPVVNGNEIMQALELKPGPWMREIIDFVADLQDENPSISKEDAIAKVREKFSGVTSGVTAGVASGETNPV